MTPEPVWVRADVVEAIHRRQLAEHGGAEGVRDAGALASALDRPRNRLTYGNAAPQRMVPAMAFVGAPRMHRGGWAGLRPDEVPAILQKGERVLNRREAAQSGTASSQNITINIQTRDAESFRQSRTQVSADIARAVAMGRRGM